ncbi:MAG: type III pantothenate kinase [Candidatus Krumholzibacteriota bacterium]|nr:type III pantothenate kinase [Candidatus Krumholzibacteriota bacterium]
MVGPVLTLDRGNFYLKAALFSGNSLIQRWRCGGGGLEQLSGILEKNQPEGLIFSSVIQEWSGELLALLKEAGVERILRVGPELRYPFKLDIDNPETVGPDRLCAACGALAGGFSEAVIVDAGTAVTVDLLRRGVFAGGAIMPGLHMMLRSLHRGTSALPEIGLTPVEGPPPGRNTAEAMARGVFYGWGGAVKELVGWSRRVLGPAAFTIITGGDAEHLDRFLEEPRLLDPDLVHRGLFYLYGTNAGIPETNL